MAKGIFISFEGTEGAGKSTQIQLLNDELVKRGYDVLLTREPGGSEIGDKISHMVKYYTGPEGIAEEAEVLLFAASRAQLVQKRLIPHLENGGVVICDRFADSTEAYQGYGRGIDRERIQDLIGYATGGLMPDLTLLLDLSIEKGMARVGKRAVTEEEKNDRIEAAGREFHENVRKGFLEIAKRDADRVKVIDADQSVEAIQQDILKEVNHVFA